MFYVIRNGLHGYQYNCSHMTTRRHSSRMHTTRFCGSGRGQGISGPMSLPAGSVADPGFPRGGGTNPKGGQHTILPNFPKNCIKLKEFGLGGVSITPPLIRQGQGIHEGGRISRGYTEGRVYTFPEGTLWTDRHL